MGEPKTRIDGIDFLRGVLMLLVIAGHVVLGSALRGEADSSIVRYAIYSFHMPLFLALCGYLVSRESLRTMRCTELLKKYWLRLGVPYLLAFLVYTIPSLFLSHQEAPVRVNDVISAVLYPLYHLWFVPAYLLMMLATWALVRAHAPIKLLTVLAATFSVLWLATEPVPVGRLRFLVYLGDKRFYYYFCYFLLGFCLRNEMGRRWPPWALWALWALAGASFGARILLFYVSPDPLLAAVLAPAVGLSVSAPLLDAVSVTAVGLLVSAACIRQAARAEVLRVWPINWMGRESLPIYLWHAPIVTFLGRRLILEHWGPATYYVTITAVLALVFLPMVKVGFRIGALDRYVLGSPREKVASNPEGAGG